MKTKISDCDTYFIQERMGSEASDREAEVMHNLLIGSSYKYFEEITDEVWNEFIVNAIKITEFTGWAHVSGSKVESS